MTKTELDELYELNKKAHRFFIEKGYLDIVSSYALILNTWDLYRAFMFDENDEVVHQRNLIPKEVLDELKLIADSKKFNFTITHIRDII